MSSKKREVKVYESCLQLSGLCVLSDYSARSDALSSHSQRAQDQGPSILEGTPLYNFLSSQSSFGKFRKEVVSIASCHAGKDALVGL